jgi:catechol 2,3-dioxygenase-like lactoylglutathione lyase family enzyme
MTPQPMICVADVEASSAWYQRTLGFASAHGGPEYEMLTADGRLALQLHAWERDEHPHMGDPALPPGNGALLWFETPDIAAAWERAQGAGATVLEALHVNPLAHHREFWLRDPDGYVVVVSSPFGDT